MNRNNQNPNNQSPHVNGDSNDNSEPLPFGSFEDQLEPTKASQTDDRSLVAFLRQHQPVAPLESSNFEGNLMAAIAQEPIPTSNLKKAKRLPQIIGAIAAGLVGDSAGVGNLASK